MASGASARLPGREQVHVLLAHAAYQLGAALGVRAPDIQHTEVRDQAALKAALPKADVLVISGLWRNEVLDGMHAPRLRFIQSIGAGTDQFPRDQLAARGIRLASAQGVNERAVSEHAMALMLAMVRQLHLARDNQHARLWRGMIADIARRESEVGGKTLVIVGLGRIGARLAGLARAFGMQVIGVKRDPIGAAAVADEVVPTRRLHEALARADIVALTCPLTPDTQGLIDAAALAAMKPTALLINVARGRVVDEPALISALRAGRIAGAALDCVAEEPLPASSPLWAMPNVLITPHTAGETQRYEDNVIDVLLDNLGRLWSGNPQLRNQVV